MTRKRRILLVDDEPAILEGLEESLRREPYMIQTATSAAAALEVMAVSACDVVISDERMPGMPGSELLGVVCRQHPQVIRILLTGQATLEAAVRAINEGEVFRILLKPCAPDELRRVLKAAIQVKALHEETARLLLEVRRRGRVLDHLEQKHPGITTLSRERDGTLHMPEADAHADMNSLLQEIERELGGAAEAA